MQPTVGFQRYLKNTSWLLAEKVISMMTILIVSVYMARYLGPDRLGLLSYSQSLVILFSPLAKLGFDHVLVRELVQDETRRDVLLGTCFLLQLAGALVACIILGSSLAFTHSDAQTNVLIAIIGSSLLFQCFGVIDVYFQAKVLSKYAVTARTVAGIIVPAIILVLVFVQAPLICFALAILLQHLLTYALFVIAYFMQKLSILQWRFDKKVGRQIMKNSWPLVFAGLMVVVYMRIDQIMLKNMADSTQVGIYVAAVRFSEVWYFFPLLVTQSVFPAIVNAKRNDPLQYRQRMQQLYDVMTFVSLGIAVTLTFSASLLMERLYGQSYSGSDKVLAVHIWAGVIVFFGTTRGKWIIAENLQKKALIVDITGAVLNVILNLILIPYYNALGAAIATLLSYACTILATSIAIKEFREPFVMYMKSFVHCVTLRTIRQLVAGKYFV